MATTEQLMAQYGVAWFGFDESSGNVYDKLGLNNYVGTVTGATRVQGWNGEGNAMSFNGSNNYVQFNNKIIPNGEKTVHLKIKAGVQSTYSIVMDTTDTNLSSLGVTIRLENNGKLYIAETTGTSSLNAQLYSNQVISDSRWHDILYSWNGASNGLMYLYIDGVLDIAQRAMITQTGHPSFNLILGKRQSQSAGYFNGQIDDLQIYNKALSPSDFTQKRLVVKTTDNKNLVLSPNSARVKEIPSTIEDTLLSQGGIIKEIDSAVDRPLMDLTRATTEYEITNNINSALGSGKAFTVPITTNFKTIVIEDNY